MTYETNTHAPVLIAGAGPAGLTAAITLARQGIESLVVERKRELSSLPRATVISTRSMELFRSWGLEDAVRAGGVEVEWKMLACESLARASAGAAIPVACRRREQSALISPAAPACVPQDHPERVLLDHLRSLGRARVLLRHGGRRPRAGRRWRPGRPARPRRAGRPASSTPATSSQPTVRTARSAAHWASPCTVPTGTSTRPSALFRAPLWDVVGAHRYGIYNIGHPEAAGALLPAGPGDRWLTACAGSRARGGSRTTPKRGSRADPPRHRRRPPAAADRAHRWLLLRRATRRALPQRQRVPRRRRRAPRAPRAAARA